MTFILAVKSEEESGRFCCCSVRGGSAVGARGAVSYREGQGQWRASEENIREASGLKWVKILYLTSFSRFLSPTRPDIPLPGSSLGVDRSIYRLEFRSAGLPCSMAVHSLGSRQYIKSVPKNCIVVGTLRSEARQQCPDFLPNRPCSQKSYTGR